MTGSVFGTIEAWEFELLLAALAEPDRSTLVKAALATFFFGLTASGIEGFETDDRQWGLYQSRFLSYHEQWRRDGILAAMRRILNDERVRERLLPQAGERKLTNILHLAELLHARELESPAGEGALVKWLVARRLQCDDSVPPDEEMLRLDSDEEAVRIVTIHKSKGLEYPVVFCPFNWHRSRLRSGDTPLFFHDPGNDFEPSLAVGDEAIRNAAPLAEEELLAENMRLLYVALTRAKCCCYCVWSPTKGAESSALAWLLFGKSPLENPAQLGAKVCGLSDRDIAREIADRLGGTNSIETAPLPPESAIPLPGSQMAGRRLAARPFSGTIPLPRRVLSYSYLAHSASDREDGVFDERAFSPAESGVDTATDFRAFPRGARAGLFLHELFEEIDFPAMTVARPPDGLAIKLDRYGFSREWLEPVWNMMRTVSTTPLDKATDLRLEKILPRNCIKEMEFYFPGASIQRRGTLFRDRGDESRSLA